MRVYSETMEMKEFQFYIYEKIFYYRRDCVGYCEQILSNPTKLRKNLSPQNLALGGTAKKQHHLSLCPINMNGRS